MPQCRALSAMSFYCLIFCGSVRLRLLASYSVLHTTGTYGSRAL